MRWNLPSEELGKEYEYAGKSNETERAWSMESNTETQVAKHSEERRGLPDEVRRVAQNHILQACCKGQFQETSGTKVFKF